MKKVILFVGIFVMLACSKGQSEAQPKAGDDKKPANEGKYYSTQISPDKLTVNEQGTVVLSLVPGSGYKWNAEYPAKFKLSAPSEVKLDKNEFSFKNKDIKTDKKQAHLSLPMTISAAGNHAIKVDGNFSVCNDTSCKIMRRENFTITVVGK